MARKVLEMRTVASVVTRLTGHVVNVTGTRRPTRYDIKASHSHLSVDQKTLNMIEAEVRRVCPHLVSANTVAAGTTQKRPTPPGVLFHFPR